MTRSPDEYSCNKCKDRSFLIECACGKCSIVIPRADRFYKIRQFIKGHAPHAHWKGGRHQQRGYWHIWKPDHKFALCNGYILEHRWIMEQHLGRLLEPKESIHHINGDKLDNRIENLQLFESFSKHLSFERKDLRKSILHKQRISESVKKLPLSECFVRTQFKKGYAPWNRHKSYS